MSGPSGRAPPPCEPGRETADGSAVERVRAGARGHGRRRERRHPKITSDIIDAHVWYALQVAPRKEFAAMDILKDRGLMTYVPVTKVWRFRNRYARARGDKKLVSYPQLPGYVLVGFRRDQLAEHLVPKWLRLFEIPIVRGAVGIDGSPCEVARASLKAFAQRYPNGLQRPRHERYQRTHAEFAVGDRVRICEGPFEGHTVPVVSIAGSKTTVTLDLLGSERTVAMNTFDLEREG